MQTAHQCLECGGVYCVDHIEPEQHGCDDGTAERSRASRLYHFVTVALTTVLGLVLWPVLAVLGRLRVPSVWGVVRVGLVLAVLSGGMIYFDVGPGASVDEAPLEDGARSVGGVVDGVADVLDTSNDEEKIEYMVHERINDRREENGLAPISQDEELEEVAAYHNENMHEGGYFAHESPSGETMSDRYERFDYQCRVPTGDGSYATGGENIWSMEFEGTHYDDEEIAEKIVEGWMNSPGHRENILTPYWRTEGVDVKIYEEDGTTFVYATQNFC